MSLLHRAHIEQHTQVSAKPAGDASLSVVFFTGRADNSAAAPEQKFQGAAGQACP